MSLSASARLTRLLEEEDLTSLASPRSQVAPETVSLQLQQFLDEWHYRIMRTSLGRKWSREKVVKSAIRLLALNGLDGDESELDKIHTMDEHNLLPYLVGMMPIEMLDGFEHFSMQVQLVLQMVTSIRAYLEDNDIDALCDVVEGTESSGNGIGHQLLKEALVAAAREVQGVHALQDSWVHSTAVRVDRLANAQECAETCEEQTLKVEARLAVCQGVGKASAWKVLRAISDQKTVAIQHKLLIAWQDSAIRLRKAREFRKQQESEVEDLERKLQELKLTNSQHVMVSMKRLAQDADRDLLALLIEEWLKIAESERAHRRMQEEHAALEAKLKAGKESMAGNATKMLVRMNGGNESALYAMVFQGFCQHTKLRKQEREFEEQVAKQEAALAEHRAKRQDAQQSCIHKLKAAFTSGLLQNVLSCWFAYAVQNRLSRRRSEMTSSFEGRLKSCQVKQRLTGASIQRCLNSQDDWNLLSRCFSYWNLEAKVNQIEKHYTYKLESKRRQLNSVQNLFKSFAKQLEDGLGSIDGDSSGRGTRPSRTRSKTGSFIGAVPTASPIAFASEPPSGDEKIRGVSTPLGTPGRPLPDLGGGYGPRQVPPLPVP